MLSWISKLFITRFDPDDVGQGSRGERLLRLTSHHDGKGYDFMTYGKKNRGANEGVFIMEHALDLAEYSCIAGLGWLVGLR